MTKAMTEAEPGPNYMLSEDYDPHTLPWYEPELQDVEPEARQLLEKYSKIPSDEVVQHVNNMRDRAFAVFPYPCVGAFRFLDMSIPQQPIYPEILERLKSGQKLLDVGCALGQELRRLVFDGVPSENLYASDLRRDFFSISFDLFNDHTTLKTQFVESDIFDPTSQLVQQLTGKMDIVNAASFFHLFAWDQQVAAVRQVIALLRPRPGSLVIGRQAARKDPIDPDNRENAPKRYRHDVETWKRLWRQVEVETGTRWEVEAWLEVWEGVDSVFKRYHPGVETFKMNFVSRRL
ncbi:uncharacterized protein N7496_000619 [Penicillium cataractarum]|uniref:Methyltransferase domain-containing protein n=1 Tax=Penicillium cataractarum TaxID=2100454 RepID=A0A9W9VUF3_9EURO|nr:uncharacterized protein N7496_000619 [Penicillium cataractarum]KAJ5389551.1 hypothetical protein N7496_000619 [Penicillium cataractarum]